MVGWSELFGFEMVLARISGFVLFSPILGRSNIPGYAKTGLILVLSVFVYGLGQPMPAPPGTVVELVVRLGVELVVGFVLGFLMQLCAAIVQAGGEIIDAQMGLTMAQIYDASSQANMSVTMMMWNWRQKSAQTGFISDSPIWNWRTRVRFSDRIKSLV